MWSQRSLPKRFLRRLWLAVGVGAAVQVAPVAAVADGSERLGPFLRHYGVPPERQGRELPAWAPEPPRRVESEESRNPRRWSPEERRQLRQDVHEAGRDVYGGRPRRPD